MTPEQEKELNSIEFRLEKLEWVLYQEAKGESNEAAYLRKALRAIDRARRLGDDVK